MFRRWGLKLKSHSLIEGSSSKYGSTPLGRFWGTDKGRGDCLGVMASTNLFFDLVMHAFMPPILVQARVCTDFWASGILRATTLCT